jgi:transposase
MMKLQDVLLKAMAKKITWSDAAEIIGVTDRTMRRWRQRLEEDGYSGLADRRRGKPSDKRVPLATAEKVLRLFQDTYFDLNIRHFHEKLREEHGIQLSYTWVHKALRGAGLVARSKRRGKHRRRRERRPLPGMLLHIDGSKHQWFGDERWHDLIVILDDATSIRSTITLNPRTTVIPALPRSSPCSSRMFEGLQRPSRKHAPRIEGTD